MKIEMNFSQRMVNWANVFENVFFFQNRESGCVLDFVSFVNKTGEVWKTKFLSFWKYPKIQYQILQTRIRDEITSLIITMLYYVKSSEIITQQIGVLMIIP